MLPSMRALILAVLVLFTTLLGGCQPTCAGAPLAPAAGARAAVLFASDSYRAIALYDASGAPLSDRGLDGTTPWTRQSASLAGGAGLAWGAPAGGLLLTLGDAPSPVVLFDVTSGQLVFDVPLDTQAADALAIGSGVVATRGTELVTIDPPTMRVDRTQAAPVDDALGRLAPLGASRLIAGTEGAGVIVASALGANPTFVPLASFTGCAEVAALEPDPAAPAVLRVAVLCHGGADPDPNLRRLAAGVILLEATEGGAPAPVRQVRSFGNAVPSSSLVALGGSFVAFRAGGSLELAVPDSIVFVDLATGASEQLATESWSLSWGAPLGGGDAVRASTDGGASVELWWPSVSQGVLRWRFDPAGTPLLTALAPATPPACVRVPARTVRAIR